MTLPAGTRLGAFEVLAQLGAGGMGEVYRARDTRLDREVALKVLPAEFANDQGRLKRFEKEARGASALNHPSIVTIYEIGGEYREPFIAMELVAGKTLRETLQARPLPWRKVLAIASQIADGLAAAHEAGIVHRDLKPDNVMITRDGNAKILDFGLAKLARKALDEAEVGQSTLSRTEPGGLLGTVGYMSPEQAAGQSADFRSDQFSFGSMLYEMATGRKAFHGPTSVDTLSAILHAEPEPIPAIRSDVPAPLAWIVERCLAKDPAERFADTRDLARDVRALRDHLPSADSESSGRFVFAPRPGKSLARLLPALSAVALLALAFFIGRAAFGTRPSSDSPSVRRVTFQRGSVTNARFAPDGETIVYSAAWEGRPQEIFVTRLDATDSRPLGISRAQLLSVSKRGQLALLLKEKYLASGRGAGTLALVSIVGGTPRQVQENLDKRIDWGSDGETLAAVRHEKGIDRIEYPIGKTFFTSTTPVRSIRVSPDGSRVAFIEGTSSPSVVVEDRSGARQVLATGFSRLGEVAWSPDGREVWFSGVRGAGVQGLFAARSGAEPRTLWRTFDTPTLLDVSRNGNALVKSEAARKELWFGGPAVKAERELSWLDRSQLRDLSLDGRKVLIEEGGLGGGDAGSIYLRDVDGSPAVRLGAGRALGLSPDARWVLALDSGKLLLLPTGPGSVRRVPVGDLRVEGAAWVPPDGRQLLITASEPGRPSRGYLMDLPNGTPRPVGPEGFVWGSLSSDGKRAIASLDGNWAIYRIDGTDPRPIPGLEPGEVGMIWNADATAIYLTRAGEIPLRIQRIDLKSGKRTLWKSFQPMDTAGVVEVNGFAVALDDATYVYALDRLTSSDLYVVQGLK